VSAASLQPSFSPGEIVSIFGSHLSTPPQNGTLNAAGLYPTTLGHTQVTFNGILAPLLYVSNTQINCVVPFGVAGQKNVDVIVSRIFTDAQYTQNNPAGRRVPSEAVSVPILDTSPGIFTVGQRGSGLGAIVNADPVVYARGTINSVDNPAPKGSAITMFATGAGAWNVAYPDGSVVLNHLRQGSASISFNALFPISPISMTIGGKPATILYAGAAPGQVYGMLQVNALVPKEIGSGAQAVILRIGDHDNADQNVMVAVQ
jgi:uncharacterized protein (TIGR03437 family)